MTASKNPKLRFKHENGKDFPDWTEIKVTETGSIITGTTPNTEVKENYGGDIPWITPTDIKDNKNIYTSERKLTKRGLDEGRFVPKNSLLVTCIASIGKNAILRVDGSCNQQINAIVPDKKFNIDFLYYLINNNERTILKYAGSGGMLIINKSDFSKIKILSPNYLEQLKIAEFLSSVDNYIQNLKSQKEELEKYKKGLMQKIFSQKLRFKDESGKDFPDWLIFNFETLFKSESSKKFQIYSSEIIKEGDFPVIDQGKDVISGYSNDKTKVCNDSPVIIFGDHTTIFKFINFPFIIGADGTKILKNNRKNDFIKFLYYLLLEYQLKPEGYKRHYSKLKKLNFLVPNTIEQNRIADFLTSIDNLIEIKRKEIENSENWKKGLMQQMFV